MQETYAIFIPAYNESSTIARCLESIITSADDQVQIYILNDHSTDETPSILAEFEKKYSNVHVDMGFGQGPAKIRNHLIQTVDCEYAIFLDGDLQVASDWFEQVKHSISYLDESRVAIGGSQRIPEDANFMERMHGALLNAVSFVSDYIHQHSDVKEVDHNPLCNVIYKRQVLLDAGLFDESFFPGEDLDMDLRLAKEGKKFMFNPRMTVFHHRPDTFKGFMKMLKRYGKAQSYLLRKHGLTQKLQVLPLICLALLAGIIMYPPALGYMLVGLALWYLLKTKCIFYALVFPLYSILCLMVWNYGFIQGLFVKVKPS